MSQNLKRQNTFMEISDDEPEHIPKKSKQLTADKVEPAPTSGTVSQFSLKRQNTFLEPHDDEPGHIRKKGKLLSASATLYRMTSEILTNSNIDRDPTSVPDMVSSSTSDMVSASTSDMVSSSTPDMTSASTSDMVSSSTSDMVSSSTPDMASASTSDMVSSSTPGVVSSSTSDMASASTSDMASASTSDMISSSTPGVVSASTPGVVSSSTSDMMSSSTSDMMSSSTSDMASASTSDMVSASTSNMVFVFGSGDTGQLGLGDSMLIRKRPMPLKVLDDKKIVDIACGGMHTLAVTEDGQLYSWGCNDQRALGRSGEEYEPELVENPDNVKYVKIACGDSVSIALSDDGKVYCWGTYRCAEGALGFSKDLAVQDIPVLFEPLATHTIVDIAAGTDHCLALTNRGRVYAWGNGQQYQLGRRVMERRKENGLKPELVALKNIKAIGAGSYHSFAISQDNHVYAWGLNNYYQCGLPAGDELIKKPTIIPGLQGPVKSVAAGEHHSYVLMENGTVYAFGRADSCQLGLPESVIDSLQTMDASNSQYKKAIGQPTLIPDLSDVVQISSGSNHALVTTRSGNAHAWGFGEMSALGNGSDDDEVAPRPVTGQKLDGRKVLKVAAGAQHSVILA